MIARTDRSSPPFDDVLEQRDSDQEQHAVVDQQEPEPSPQRQSLEIACEFDASEQHRNHERHEQQRQQEIAEPARAVIVAMSTPVAAKPKPRGR